MILRKSRRRPATRVMSFVFEATTACNHACPHCYNVWKNQPAAPAAAAAPLSTAETLDMLGRMLDQTSARLVSISGGEPLLRPDICEIVDYLAGRGVGVNLICNGTLLDEAAIARLTPDKVSIFELPLLSVERAVHDRLSGSPGAFDKVTMAVAMLKEAGQKVVCVFVATRENLPTWRQTAELAIALGADGVMFNRFNVGGAGVANADALMPTVDELADALQIGQELAERYEFPISCGVAMPPCLFDTARYPRLTFGLCAAGTERAYYSLDPAGNVRPCNHSPRVLGNIREKTFKQIVTGESMADFMAAVPAVCRPCRLVEQCQGCCKAAGEAATGDASAMDPFLAANLDRIRPIT